MNYKALFDQGIAFQTYVAQGSDEEVQAVGKAAEALCAQLNHSIATSIAAIEQEINILIAGETWCPDCQLNITAICAMAELQPKIKIAIISRDFAKENLLDKLDIEAVKIPLAVVLDQYYQPKGLFVEQPKTVKFSDDLALAAAYDQGERLNDTIAEILAIIES